MYHESYKGSEELYQRISVGDFILSPDRIGPQEVRSVQIYPMMDPVYNIVWTNDLRTAVNKVTLDHKAENSSDFYIRDIVTDGSISGKILLLKNYGSDVSQRCDPLALISVDTSHLYQREYTAAARKREEILEQIKETLIRKPLWDDLDYENAINSATQDIYRETPELDALYDAMDKYKVEDQLIPVARLEMLEQWPGNKVWGTKLSTP